MQRFNTFWEWFKEVVPVTRIGGDTLGRFKKLLRLEGEVVRARTLLREFKDSFEYLNLNFDGKGVIEE